MVKLERSARFIFLTIDKYLKLASVFLSKILERARMFSIAFSGPNIGYDVFYVIDCTTSSTLKVIS